MEAEAGPLATLDVVLVRPQQPGNVGAVARAIANHGLGRLILVAPPAFDPDRARWMAPGAAHIIDEALFYPSVAEAVAQHRRVVATSARRRRWHWPHEGPAELATRILDEPRPTALLFGPEDAGLANEDLNRADTVLVLPTSPHASLNLAQAVVVTAAHLLSVARERGEGPPGPDRQRPRRGGGRGGSPPPPEQPAPVGQVAEVVDEALPVARASTYLRGRSEEQLQGTLFRLLNRAQPSLRELSVLRGLLAKLSWRLAQPLADPLEREP